MAHSDTFSTAALAHSPAVLASPAAVPLWRRLLPYLGTALALLLFAGALIILHRQVAAYRPDDVRRALAALSGWQVPLALALAAASYLLLTLYDVLALHHVGRKLPYRRVALAAFTSYAFSHSLGFGSIVHASIRYRLYVPLGLTTGDIAEVTAFVHVTFGIGLAIIFPAVALLDPGALETLHLPHETGLLLGLGAPLLAAGYVVLGWWIRHPIEVFGFALKIPRPLTALTQIVLSVADLALAGAVLYACLPHSEAVGYPHVLAVFVLALTAGFISHVPGGLGVFDTVVVLGLSDRMPGGDILAGLLVFRVVYYLVPLIAAGALFGAVEAIQARHRLARASQTVGDWVTPGVPLVLAGCTFVSGAVLLFSNATPETGTRLRLLQAVVPLPLLEISHFIGSIAGVLLLLLARRLQRRIHAAWLLAVLLLALGSVSVLLKGLEWEEAALLGLICLALVAARREFYRPGSLIAYRFTPGWLLAVGVVLGSAFWLGLFSYRHVEFNEELWWRFAMSGDASRFLRASVAVAVVALAASVRYLLASVPVDPVGPADSAATMSEAAEIVAQSPSARANVALSGDKAFLFHPDGDSFIMYGVSGRSWIALGDPVGPQERWRDLFAAFWAAADRHGAAPVFFEISRAALPVCTKLGLSLRQIGDAAVVPLSLFSLDGAARRELRDTYQRLEQAGARCEIIEPAGVADILPMLAAVSDEWLALENAYERGFLQGRFLPAYVRLFSAAIVHWQDRVVAFASVWPSAGKAELAVDLVRHVADAPDGIVDFLLVETMLWGKEQGYCRFDLGMAPLLPGMDDRRLATRWDRLGKLLYCADEDVCGFAELRRSKERFAPQWEARSLPRRAGWGCRADC